MFLIARRCRPQVSFMPLAPIMGFVESAAMKFLVALMFLLFTSPLHAASVKPAPLSEQDRADVQRIEAYLNGIGTMRSRFLQVSSEGSVESGVLTLARPGRMRFEYDPPSPTLLIANGTFLIFVDKKLDQTTHVLLRNTPIGVLVSENVKLAGAVTITNIARGPGVIRVTLVRTEEPAEGTLTLAFADNPLQLRQWTVVDAQGLQTTVTLAELEFGVPVNREMFQYDKKQPEPQ
jgi:outer membrane lipoprotein-sorting protein